MRMIKPTIEDLEHVEGQMDNLYVDIHDGYDKGSFEVVREALRLYREKYIKSDNAENE